MTHIPEYEWKMQPYGRTPEASHARNGVTYMSFDSDEHIEQANPFIVNTYDFQEGFYRGDFIFSSPLTGESMVSTPEMYGRHKIVSNLLEEVTKRQRTQVLDIGSGTLDIARTIPPEFRSDIHMYNSDISGPWTDALGQSALERGTDSLVYESDGSHGFSSLVNIQHDFNKSPLPFAKHSMDIIVSNMAMHHIATSNKAAVLEHVFDTLRPGGVLILNDVYSRREDRAMFTKNGERGPSECKGYPISFSEAFELYEGAGFILDEVANRAKVDERNINEFDVEVALWDNGRSMPISNSVWFTILRKEEQ